MASHVSHVLLTSVFASRYASRLKYVVIYNFEGWWGEGRKLAQEVTLVSVSTVGQCTEYHDWFINKVLLLQ